MNSWAVCRPHSGPAYGEHRQTSPNPYFAPVVMGLSGRTVRKSQFPAILKRGRTLRSMGERRSHSTRFENLLNGIIPLRSAPRSERALRRHEASCRNRSLILSAFHVSGLRHESADLLHGIRVGPTAFAGGGSKSPWQRASA